MGIKIERTEYDNQNPIVRDIYSPEAKVITGLSAGALPMGTLLSAQSGSLELIVATNTTIGTGEQLFILKRDEIVATGDTTLETGVMAMGVFNREFVNFADFTNAVAVEILMNETGLYVVTGA